MASTYKSKNETPQAYQINEILEKRRALEQILGTTWKIRPPWFPLLKVGGGQFK